MQAYSHDDKVDEYEFLVSSLVLLGKVSSDDIRPIMHKFRSIAGEKGYIGMDDAAKTEHTSREPDAVQESMLQDALVVQDT